MPRLGLILTNAPSLTWLDQRLKAADAAILKVIPGWGLDTGWNATTIPVALRMARETVVRTVAGDPSAGKPLPITAYVVAEIKPWYDARDPARPFWIEIGNEPLVWPGTQEYAFVYAYELTKAIKECRKAFPQARIIGPSHILNHAIELQDSDDQSDWRIWGQKQFMAICADAYRLCDAIGLHVYLPEQFDRGRQWLELLGLDKLPLWITETNVNRSLSPADRGDILAAQWRGSGVEAVLLYHLVNNPGDDPMHFNGNYSLDVPALQALGTAWRTPIMPPSPPIHDVRPELAAYRTKTLKRGTWTIGRRTVTTAQTLHWNGPAVAPSRMRGARVMDQLKADVEWQTRPGWAGTKRGADGLQYHRAIDAEGAIWQCRDDDALLWHSAHAVGNRESLSLHLLLGRGQQPTPAQWAAAVWQMDEWRTRYGFTIARSFGHIEWSSTDCPGPDIMERLQTYRTLTVAPPPPTVPDGVRQFVVTLPAESRATVRQGPSRAYPIAGNLRSGHVVFVDAVLDDEQGKAIDGASQWAHMANIPNQQPNLGFVHLSALREAK